MKHKHYRNWQNYGTHERERRVAYVLPVEHLWRQLP